MIYYNNNLDVRFIHIPRTGGRFVRTQLQNNNYKTETDWGNSLINGKEGCHLDYQEENDFYHRISKSFTFPNIEFTIVRNPISKFNSARFWLGRILNEDKEEWEEMEEYESFRRMMENNVMWYEYDRRFIFNGFTNMINNWFTPQKNFVNKNGKTKIWKFENGFGKEWEDWMREEVGLKDFVNNQIPLEKQAGDESSIVLSNKILDNVEKYYKEDIILFGY